MPMFQYKAVSSSGEVKEGVLEGATHAGVIAHLQSLGLIPIRAAEVTADGVAAASGVSASAGSTAPRKSVFGGRGKVSQTDLGSFTRELATLLRAGLPLDRGLEILIGLAEKKSVSELLVTIRNEVRGGTSLSKALDKHRDVFSRFYINMVKAGEAGGSLGNVMQRLADYMERSAELKESVVSALIYPAILLVVAVASVMILVIFVVPQFKQIFDQSGKALPFATDVVLTTGIFLRKNWPIILAGVVLAIWLFSRSFANPATRARWDARFLHWPILGNLLGKVEMARFSRSLGTLLQNGVPLLAGLSILKDTLGNAVFRDAVDVVARDLKEGRGMAKPMMEANVFPKLAVQMIGVGEETGKLDEMLVQVAEVYDREVAAAIKRALALIEPVMIVGLALLIGGIIMSILVAMFDLMDIPL
ncbi:MAG: type II secretion system F family protein [Betaproteobacteria bacterium]|nr:type II secretion system F family protein [Betaproteobacteria bacterium]